MSKSDAGKGGVYRPVNRKRYDFNYLRIFGCCNQNLCPKRNYCGHYQIHAGKTNVSWIPQQDDYSTCPFFCPATCQVCMGKGWLYDWSKLQKKYLKTTCIVCKGKGKLFPDKETERQWIAQGVINESN